MGTKLLNVHPSVWEKLRLKANTAKDTGSGQLALGADKRQRLQAAESSEITVRLRVYLYCMSYYLMSAHFLFKKKIQWIRSRTEVI